MRYPFSILFVFLLALSAHAVTIANGQTALIELPTSETPLQLAFEGKKIPILSRPGAPDRKVALIPVGYRTAPGNKTLLLQGRTREQIPFDVVQGDYASEKLTVAPSKVSPDKKAQERISKEYREAMAVYGSFTPERYWNTPFAMPMESAVTSPFGTARTYNGKLKSFHSGTDFRAAPGTPVRAVNDGVVAIAKDRYYAGNSVVIDHGEGLYSCYYHLSRIDVKVGQKVSKGEEVGLSGHSGRVTGPHLHFAVMLQGVQVDPMQLIGLLNGLFGEGSSDQLSVISRR